MNQKQKIEFIQLATLALLMACVLNADDAGDTAVCSSDQITGANHGGVNWGTVTMEYDLNGMRTRKTHGRSGLGRNQVVEGQRLRISDLVNYKIYPVNATQDFINSFQITHGRDQVRIDGDEIVVDSNVPSGNLTFRMQANAFGVLSNEIEFNIFVPARGINFTVDNRNPHCVFFDGLVFVCHFYIQT